MCIHYRNTFIRVFFRQYSLTSIYKCAQNKWLHLHTYIRNVHIPHITNTMHKSGGFIKFKDSVHLVLFLVSLKTITSVSVRALILALHSSTLMSSSQSPQSGNLAKAGPASVCQTNARMVCLVISVDGPKDPITVQDLCTSSCQ